VDLRPTGCGRSFSDTRWRWGKFRDGTIGWRERAFQGPVIANKFKTFVMADSAGNSRSSIRPLFACSEPSDALERVPYHDQQLPPLLGSELIQKPLVGGNQKPLFLLRQLLEELILHALPRSTADVQHIVAELSYSHDGGAGNVFIDEDLHLGLLCECFGRSYLFLGELSCVGEAGKYVIARNGRVGVQESFDRVPVCQHLHDEVYRDSLPLDARLTVTDVGVDRDSLMHGHLPLHETTPIARLVIASSRSYAFREDGSAVLPEPHMPCSSGRRMLSDSLLMLVTTYGQSVSGSILRTMV
jgi:hypothetical protein